MMWILTHCQLLSSLHKGCVSLSFMPVYMNLVINIDAANGKHDTLNGV